MDFLHGPGGTHEKNTQDVVDHYELHSYDKLMK